LHRAFLLQIMSATVPAVVVLLTIPLIRAELDADGFAAFTVVLSAVGLLSVLDGGLGRASTYFISLALKGGTRRRVIDVFQGILAVGLLLSILLASTGAIAIHLLGGGAIETARPALLILLGFSPVFVAGSLLRGGLEAQQRFGRLSGLQLLHGSAIAVAPAVLFSLSPDLRWFAWTIGVARVGFALALLHACELATPATWHVTRSTRIQAVRVFQYAKWLFLSNLVGLTIVFADRLLVATLFSSALVAAYVLPMELVARLQILITAFCTVLFPRLVARKPLGGASRGQVLANAQGAVLCAFLLAAMVLSTFAEPVMRWWIGAEGAPHAAQVLVVGIVGLGLIACAALAMLDLNSRGLTRPVAWLHVAELPAYLGLLYFAARSSSIALLLGVWVLRLATDAVAMSVIASRGATVEPTRNATALARSAIPWCVAAVSLLTLCMISLNPWPLSVPLRSLVSSVGIAAALLAGARFVIQLRRSVQLAR
jgi:O-antigen/teichoic acid export membrane protein